MSDPVESTESAAESAEYVGQSTMPPPVASVISQANKVADETIRIGKQIPSTIIWLILIILFIYYVLPYVMDMMYTCFDATQVGPDWRDTIPTCGV